MDRKLNSPKRFNLEASWILCAATVALLLCWASPAVAREAHYSGGEEIVRVVPGEPTQITFPTKIEGGFKKKNSALNLDRQGRFLIVFARPDLPLDGEALLIHLDDQRSYALRVVPSDESRPRDEFVKIVDVREPDYYEESMPEKFTQPDGFAPPTVVSGLMREMMLVAEFGKRRGIVGYRRSNRYNGEVVLHDGTIEAKIDEIFIGPQLWGYVINVENLLETNQRINPATFRLDGTRAVAAQKWELTARPLTAEQEISKGHQGKVYIVTRAMRQ